MANLDSVIDPPVVRRLDEPLGTLARPLWRGRLHAFGLWVALPAVAALITVANGTRARVGVSIYAVGLLSMLAVSATYHRWVHTVRARDMWRRADHAVIFATIAGTFTPIALLALPVGWGIPLLALMWVGGLFGMVVKIFGWRHQRIAGGILYIGLGWAAALALPVLWQRAGVWPATLILLGGVFYTLGAVFLLRRWPRLRPTVFSYHEVWHACTVAAAAAHLAAVWIVVS